MCESASPTDHVLQSECTSAACSVTGSALTSLLALAASRESVKKNRNKTISSGSPLGPDPHTKCLQSSESWGTPKGHLHECLKRWEWGRAHGALHKPGRGGVTGHTRVGTGALIRPADSLRKEPNNQTRSN